jgi:hypothetical protein
VPSCGCLVRRQKAEKPLAALIQRGEEIERKDALGGYFGNA